MKNTPPPFQITPLIVSLSSQIYYTLGVITGAKLSIAPRQQQKNKIKTIQASLAIEGNRLTVEQVSDIFEGKRVLGSIKDIQEVRNAIKLYEMISNLNPVLISDFKKAHKILMDGLIEQNGMWRTTGVAVFSGQKIVH